MPSPKARITVLLLPQLVPAFVPETSNVISRLVFNRHNAASTKGSTWAVDATRTRRASGLQSLSSSQETPPWRFQLDELFKSASPWGSASQAEILAVDLLKRLPEVAEDVTDAARRGTLLSDVVLAKGTEARYTVDGLKAVNRQLQQDILPQALEAAPRVAKAASKSFMQPPRLTDIVRQGISSGTDKQATGPMEGLAQTLYSIREAGRNITPQRVSESLQTVRAEAANIVSRTPEGLYTPQYIVEERREGFEVRRYLPYAVASAPMADGWAVDTGLEKGEGVGSTQSEAIVGSGATAGSGEGFNTLAGYLFGNNTQERSMSMTTPVNIDVGPSGERTMSFIMPKEISAGDAPVPRNPRIGISDVANGETLAVREFPGFATDGEIRRQVKSIIEALDRETKSKDGHARADDKESSSSPWRAEDPTGSTFRLMQYNPPYTLPWLRTNEIAVKVRRDAPVEKDAGSGEAEGAVGRSPEVESV